MRVGPAAAEAITGAGFEIDHLDATGCYVVPGFVDPHQHLIGAGGEDGFASRTPEVQISELITSGITTVVGCLGTDSISRHLTSLLVKVHSLNAEGVSAYMYTGAFRVPPPTITGSTTGDIVLCDPIIGTGELAVSDGRSSEPSAKELAQLVSETANAGDLSGKAGVTHFHMGSGKDRLKPIEQLLDDYEIEPKRLYPTHVTRTPRLFKDAIALAKRGAFADTDAIEPGIGKHIRTWLESGAPAHHLSISSDAHASASAHRLYEEFVASIQEHGLDIQTTLPFFTRNAAEILHLKHKGQLQPGADADILILDQRTLEIRHVVARGEIVLRNGTLIKRGKYEHLARA